MAAEQLYKASKEKGDHRKEEAAKLAHQFAEAAGVEVTKPLKDIINGSIEAAVYLAAQDGGGRGGARARGSRANRIKKEPPAGLGCSSAGGGILLAFSLAFWVEKVLLFC